MARFRTHTVSLYSRAPKTPARIGLAIQVDMMVDRADRSVTEPLNQFQPMMAPTTAWVVETGSRAKVIQ